MNSRPPYLRRRFLRSAALFYPAMAVGVLAPVIGMVGWGPGFLRIQLVALLWMLGLLIILGIGISRLHAKLRAADGLLCVRCAYDLSGLEPEGRCPECGEPYTLEATARRWKGGPVPRKHSAGRGLTAPPGIPPR